MSERTEHGRSDNPGDPGDARWFENWFASEFYLKLYSHRDHDEAESCIDLILRSTGLDRASVDPLRASGEPLRALDLASGPGRHAIALARRGFDVTAVDLSPTLLRHARSEADAAGVRIEFIESDMRAIAFDGAFDLGVQLFTSFGYFDDEADDRLVLQHVRRSLRDGGHYALDLINEGYLRHNLVPRSTRSIDGIVALEERWIAGGRINKSITIPAATELRFSESVRLFSPAKIEQMLLDADLSPAHWFGDYNGSPYDETASKRMIVICGAG